MLRPDQLVQFFLQHPDTEFVGHNIAFDFWVIHKYLGEENGQFLFDLADRGRFHDTMLMDQLIALAKGSGSSHQRNLGEVVRSYHPTGSVDKESPYRLRFGELLNREDEWPKLDQGFFEYAVADTANTLPVWMEQVRIASELYRASGLDRLVPGGSDNLDRDSSLAGRFGLLTEAIQVRASIALARSSALGFGVDQSKVAGVEERLTARIEELLRVLRDRYPQVLKFVGGAGGECRIKRVRSTVAPTLDTNGLRDVLSDIATSKGVRPPTTDSGAVTTALDPWRQIAPDNEFVRTWSEVMDTTKTLQFASKLKARAEEPSLFDEGKPGGYLPEVHPRYTTIIRTGRTSASDPNIQQIPREGWFRELFTARPGYTLVVADYSAIELVTLAAVLKRRYGKSVLAEVLTSGRDPHVYTAAMVMGIKPECWGDFSENQPHEAKHARQGAKAINFGVPGGLGASHLAEYASSNYGVTMSEEQAGELRKKLISVVYPELSLYLQDDPFRVLAGNLSCTKNELWDAMWKDERPHFLPHVVKKIVSGSVYKSDGTCYDREFVARIWSGLRPLMEKSGRSEKWKEMVRLGQGCPALAERLFRERAITLTGRIRDNISYTEARNTPFQGLAADGAKIALWRLTKAGYRIVAFVHDEVVVEVPQVYAESAEKEVVYLMSGAMTEAIQCDIPIKVSSMVTKSWSKP